jgi:hypothetical protein
MEMGTRQSEIITISVPPSVAKEYRSVAKKKGESASALFREMFERFRKDELEEQLGRLQAYGRERSGGGEITEKEIEKLVFGGR